MGRNNEEKAAAFPGWMEQPRYWRNLLCWSGRLYMLDIYICFHYIYIYICILILKYWIRSHKDSSSSLSHLTGRLSFIAHFVLNGLDPLFYRHIAWFQLICIFSSDKTMLLKAAVRRKYEKILKHCNKKQGGDENGD